MKGQRLQDQLARPGRLRDLLIRVVLPRLLCRVPGRDDIGVGQLSVRDVVEIIPHRTAVAKPRIALLVAEVGYFRLLDRAFHVRKFDEQAQADESSDGLPLRRRHSKPVGGGSKRCVAVLLATLLPARWRAWQARRNKRRGARSRRRRPYAR